MTEENPLVQGLLGIHKVITRGLAISIQKCDEYMSKDGILQREAAGFSMYVSTLKWITHSHHLSEDEVVFPEIKDRIVAPYERLHGDHQEITRILDSVGHALSGLSNKNGVEKVQRELREFEKPWGPHIRTEEESFAAEKVLLLVGTQEQLKLSAKVGEHGMKSSGPPTLGIPFLLYNLEGNDRATFSAPFPWILKRVLVPIIWRRRWKPMGPFLLP